MFGYWDTKQYNLVLAKAETPAAVFLIVPRYRLSKTYGRLAFSVAGTTVWTLELSLGQFV